MAPRAPTWRKSSHSETNDCVEVKLDVDDVGVRDTKDRDGELTIPAPAWQAAINQLRQA